MNGGTLMEPKIVQESEHTGPILEVENMTVFRSGKPILRDIDLKVFKGEFVGIVGPNGSGKSTLLLSILGLLKIQKGTVRIFNGPPASIYLFGKIGWVSQAASNLPRDIKITVQELVQLGTINTRNMLRFISKERRECVERAIQMVDLQDVRTSEVGRLSGGQRQRAVIARALASDAELIILDEPLVGIDRESRNSLLKLLDNLCHEQGKTILMVSHDLAAIRQTSHRMVFLEETIRYDGDTANFPNLSELADLRGIHQVHEHKHSHSKKPRQEEK